MKYCNSVGDNTPDDSSCHKLSDLPVRIEETEDVHVILESKLHYITSESAQ